ncbi:MAG TPA: sulfite exporter TauE/SafE family protein [Gemmatimonadaceae bacterium]|nr:sulfite exporter TauE/SafE family protein [Gemmatimonadaceae bacterium]
MIPLAISALVAALLGSGHCAAMCGAFACASADVATDLPGRLRAAAAYHGGRLGAYLALGLLAGAIGAGVDAAASLRMAMRPAAVLGGAMLVVWGLGRLAGLAGVRVPRIAPPRGAYRLMSRALRRVAGRAPLVRAALVGALALLLPCGWLYAFVASAASTGSVRDGAAVMAGFWIGTVPALTVVSLGLHRALGPARRLVPVATAVALILVGSMTLVHGMRAGAAPMHQHAPADARP